MPQLFGLHLVWFGFLVLRFSCQLREDFSRTRRLCGRYLVKEIEKLCGKTNWSLFRLEGVRFSKPPKKIEVFRPKPFKRPQAPLQTPLPIPLPTPLPTPLPEPERVTTPASTSTSQKNEKEGLKLPPLSDYQYENDNWLPEETGEFSSSEDVNPHIHDSIKFQKKRIHKNKTSQGLFWGNHPQRKRRGFSNKCCLKGCSKSELAIACLPYIDFHNSDKRTITFD